MVVPAAVVARLYEGAVGGQVAASEAAQAELLATRSVRTLAHRRVVAALACEVMTVAESALLLECWHDAERKTCWSLHEIGVDTGGQNAR